MYEETETEFLKQLKDMNNNLSEIWHRQEEIAYFVRKITPSENFNDLFCMYRNNINRIRSFVRPKR